ncbi:hypothetical protein TorRG33x02_312630 [Trema orientale]|uniref:Uncharacterized protein n=1 Tax=Trema orientale TaxID=63057 RepID=A0A2P5BQ69_TREOI|nr:hypothetical protein TorRG33x02_312630 [Trema orientale]
MFASVQRKFCTCFSRKLYKRLWQTFKGIKRLHPHLQTWATREALVDLHLEETDCTVHVVPLTGPQAPELPWPLPLAQLPHYQPSTNHMFR